MDTPEQTPQTPQASQTSPLLDATAPAINEALERRRAQQSLPLGIVTGLVAALVGAVLWAVVTYATGMQIGWMAIGVGFLVGYAMRRFGRGIDTSFKVIGAIYALLGCVLGNVFTIYAYAAHNLDMNVFDVMTSVDFGRITAIMEKTFSPIDLFFYCIAIYQGWRFSTLPAVARTAV